MRYLPIVLFSLLYSFTCQAETIHIIAVGDVLIHKPLRDKGMKLGFTQLWSSLIPELKKADITYGNLEGPVAAMVDSRGRATESVQAAYTTFPMFNYPPSLVSGLKDSGFDVVSTANNHALDRYGAGIDKTIAVLSKNELAFTGTKKSGSQERWFAETNANGISIAWLACTQDTNGINDTEQQVLLCHRDQELVLSLIAELAKTHDAVIVTPHWGVEYQLTPDRSQRRLAQQFADAGAMAILGSHPHCVQPFDWIKAKSGQKVFVAYSLGNFISNQGSLKNRSSGLLSLYVKKNEVGTHIDKVNYQPTYMENRGGEMQVNWVNSRNHPAYLWLKKVVGEHYLKLAKESDKQP
ncbi:hypothetical protein B1207_02025 [Legionella quinlivanii]|uniref:Capsule synthesis protein CapA domain-containing protein n=1 Tax=Legionella quinlivanii TaxID=45073 RepID=A0A364LNP3_9GAMM|nr:CapA family protein [Legionella quinlivanii]RAP38679.1 hypothetical protein B1207_02025 [Legionella quinlivanii]